MLQVGFGVGDITPEPGMEMPGGFTKRVGKGVRDPLLAVACVVFDGTTPVALVGIDALFVTKSTVEHARRVIQKETRIPGENVLVGANHTHSGGPVASCLGCDENPAYTDRMARAVAGAVADAWRSLHPAQVGIGVGREPTIAFNRRFLMRDGREITHPGKPGTPHHKDIVAPAGPVDPEVGVLAVRRPDGRVCGVVVHFTCHSTVVGGDLFSPDYAGYLRKHLKRHFGADVPVGFLLGPCGDITQVNNLREGSEFGPEYADMMGRKLATEAVNVINNVPWLSAARTGVVTQTLPLALRQEPDPERERPPFGLGSGPDEVYANERRLVAEERARTPQIPCEVQAIRIGPLGIATNGAEYFCEYGLRIKQCSPFTPTWVVSLANEWIGYVPTAQAFTAGGYEPRTARSSKMAPDTGQRLLEAALAGLHRLAGA
jgi:hypothetical protein